MVATNPDINLTLSSLRGTERTLDDWQTMFHLCLVIVPDQPDGAAIVPAARAIFDTLGDADCRTAYVVPSTATIARRILEEEADRALVLLDTDRALVNSLGLKKLPALVHLRQDSTVEGSVEGWDRAAWQQVVNGLAKSMAWTTPQVPEIKLPTASWAQSA